MANDINSFIEENVKFLKLEDGQVFEGYYIGNKVIPNRFKEGEQTVEYKVATLKGKRITWTNGTLGVARRFTEVDPGERIKITRNGLGAKTNYTILAGEKLGPALDVTDETPF